MTIPLYNELDPSPADIAMRLCELNSDEYFIVPSEPIYISDEDDIGITVDLDDIMRFICAVTQLELHDGDESNTEDFTYRLSMMHDAVRDWLFKNVNEVTAFAAVTNTIRVELLSSGAYKITTLSKITESVLNQYTSNDMDPAEIKKRKMLLAALAALRHERCAEIAYLKNDIAAFAVHFSYMWRSYARLATYPALHDGRALEEGRSKGGGRPTKDRKALKRLLQKFSPDYLNKEISCRQIWSDVREGLGSDGRVTPICGSSFYYQPEATSAGPTDGTIVEKKRGREEEPLVFKSFSRVVGSLREAQ